MACGPAGNRDAGRTRSITGACRPARRLGTQATRTIFPLMSRCMTEPLALYIHWPFCLAKCPYCDFNSHVRERIPQARFASRPACRELAWEAARLGRRRLGSIFFGGGTPSLMEPGHRRRPDRRRHDRLFEPAPDLEITLEANPTSVEAGSAGRLSATPG